jgi:phage repressor protein C with HTH and peptisase S24 domain
MVPTLRHGDVILVRRTGRPRVGDVVIGRFRSRPDLLVVKRVIRSAGDGWWLVGDNPLVGDDSRTFGVADVLGRVSLRCWPEPGCVKGGLGH